MKTKESEDQGYQKIMECNKANKEDTDNESSLKSKSFQGKNICFLV